MPVYEALEAQSIFFELLDRAERGEEIVITRPGKPVMKLVPVEAKPAVDPDAFTRRIVALRQQAIAWRKTQGQPPVSLDEALSWRDEGRRDNQRNISQEPSSQELVMEHRHSLK